MKENYYLIIFILVIILIVILCYYRLQKIDYKVSEEKSIKLLSEKELNIGRIESEPVHCKFGNSIILYGLIPQDYLYWTFGLFNTKNECFVSINMGKYQTVHPGSSIALILVKNKMIYRYSKRLLEKEHYKKFPNRRLYFEPILITDDKISLYCECYFKNGKEIFPCFSFTKYSFENVAFLKLQPNIIKDPTFRMTEKMHSKITESILNKTFSNFEKIEIFKNVSIERQFIECTVNSSNVLRNIREIIIISVDHFMSRSSIHSHIIFVNEDDGKIFDVYYTGVISRKINHDSSQTVHLIEKTIPENIKSFKIIEKIFYDPDNGSCPHSETVIPMIVFIKK